MLNSENCGSEILLREEKIFKKFFWIATSHLKWQPSNLKCQRSNIILSKVPQYSPVLNIRSDVLKEWIPRFVTYLNIILNFGALLKKNTITQQILTKYSQLQQKAHFSDSKPFDTSKSSLNSPQVAPNMNWDSSTLLPQNNDFLKISYSNFQGK